MMKAREVGVKFTLPGRVLFSELHDYLLEGIVYPCLRETELSDKPLGAPETMAPR